MTYIYNIQRDVNFSEVNIRILSCKLGASNSSLDSANKCYKTLSKASTLADH